MDKNEYTRRYYQLKDIFFKENLKLHKEYIESNARFKVGDFVGNVTGIVQVEKIHGDGPYLNFGTYHEGGAPTIKYFGLRYKKVKGKLIRTKCNAIDYLTDYDNKSLNLIKVVESDGEFIYKTS